MKERVNRAVALIGRAISLLFCGVVTLLSIQIAHLEQLTRMHLRQESVGALVPLIPLREMAMPVERFGVEQLGPDLKLGRYADSAQRSTLDSTPNLGLETAPKAASQVLPPLLPDSLPESLLGSLSTELPQRERGGDSEPRSTQLATQEREVAKRRARLARQAELSLDSYDKLNLWQRPLWLMSQPYGLVQRIGQSDFYPAIPLTLSALIYAIYGYIASRLLIWLLRALAYGIFSRKKPATPTDPTSQA